jgi:hypothetical protein
VKISPQDALSCLIQASGKQTKDLILEANLYREIGFEGENARLGWVIPPAWLDIERTLNEFMSLEIVKGKTHYIFSGMGGSINAVKALIRILGGKSRFKLYQRFKMYNDPALNPALYSKKR